MASQRNPVGSGFSNAIHSHFGNGSHGNSDLSASAGPFLRFGNGHGNAQSLSQMMGPYARFGKTQEGEASKSSSMVSSIGSTTLRLLFGDSKKVKPEDSDYQQMSSFGEKSGNKLSAQQDLFGLSSFGKKKLYSKGKNLSLKVQCSTDGPHVSKVKQRRGSAKRKRVSGQKKKTPSPRKVSARSSAKKSPRTPPKSQTASPKRKSASRAIVDMPDVLDIVSKSPRKSASRFGSSPGSAQRLTAQDMLSLSFGASARTSARKSARTSARKSPRLSARKSAGKSVKKAPKRTSGKRKSKSVILKVKAKEGPVRVKRLSRGGKGRSGAVA